MTLYDAPMAPPEAPRTRRLSLLLLTQMFIRLLGLLSGVVVAALLARNLTKGDFGDFSLALSLAAVAAGVTDFGLTATAVKKVAQDPSNSGRTAGALVVIRLIAGVAGTIAISIVAVVLIRSRESQWTSLFVALTLLAAVLTALQPLTQAHLRLGRLNLLLLTQSALWTGTVVVLAYADAPLIAYGIGFFGCSVLQGLLSWVVCRLGMPRPKYSGAWPQVREMVSGAWLLGLAGMFVTTYYRIPGIVLYAFDGREEAADFAVALRVLDVIQILPITALTALLPLLAKGWAPAAEPADVRRRGELFRLAMSAMVTLALPAVVGGILVSGDVVRLLYGSNFESAAPVLRVVLLTFIPICFGYILVAVSIASGRLRVYAAAAATAAVVNIASNFLLIPRYGALGAAWTTVITEVLVASALMVIVTRSEKLGLPIRQWSEASISVAVMGSVFFFPLGSLPLPLQILVAACVYLSSLLLVGRRALGDLVTVLRGRRG